MGWGENWEGIKLIANIKLNRRYSPLQMHMYVKRMHSWATYKFKTKPLYTQIVHLLVMKQQITFDHEMNLFRICIQILSHKEISPSLPNLAIC